MPSCGTGVPYASHTELSSGAVSELRPAAFTAARIFLTSAFLVAIAAPYFESSLDHVLGAQRRDLVLRIAQLLQHLVGVLAEERRAQDFGGAVRHLDRVADGEVLAARRMVDLDDGPRRAERRLLRDLLHRQDRP